MRKFLLIGITILYCYTGNAATTAAYLNLNLGLANVQDWWSSSTAITINGGYRFNKYGAAEVGFTWIYPNTANYQNNNLISGSYQQTQSFIDIAAKGTLPFSNIFNVYIKGGLGASLTGSTAQEASTISSNGVSPGILLAMGGEFILSQYFTITIEDYGMLVLGNNNYGNLNVFAIGTSYLF